jgi:transcriptional regulator with XRE-family HTH domain
MATFGEILRELRDDRKLSQQELAQLIYVTAGTISNYENNRHLPDVDKLILLADHFGVTTDYLLGRSSSNLSPDIFDESISSDQTLGGFIEDFRSLTPDRRHLILLSIKDMKVSMMLNQYSKKDFL